MALLLPRLLRRLRSPRTAVVAVVAVDILVRAASSERLVGGVLAGVSLLGGQVTELAGWGVVLVLLVAFAPQAYPTLGEAVGRRSGFRLLFAGVTLSIAVLASGLRTVAAVLVAIGTAYVGAGLFVAYLRLVLRWRLLEPDPRTIAPVDAMFPRDDLRAEVERDLARDGALGVVGTALWVLAVGLFFVLPCFVAAVVVVALARAASLPDLVALGYAAWPVVAPRLDLGRSLPEPLADVEAHLLGVASRCTESITGASLGLLVALGLFASGSLLRVAVVVAGAVVRGRIPIGGPGDASSLVGIAVVLAAAGGYGLWYWYRQLRRVPAFLDGLAGEPATPPVARPRAGGLPAAAAVLVALVAAAGAPSSLWSAFGLAWPLVVGWLVVLARDGFERTPGDAGRELLASVVAAAAFQTAAVLVVAVVRGRPAELTTPVRLEPGLGELLVLGGLLVAFLGGLGAASHYGDRRGGVGRYALPVYAVASGVVMLLVRPLGGSAVATLLTVLSVVLLFGGGAHAVVKYYGL